MDIMIYELPTMAEGRLVVETKYCEILNKYRRGETLDAEVLDWMDSANNWLMTAGTKL